MYRSDFCDVDYLEKLNVVFVKWKKFCCGEDYRKPLREAVRIMAEHEDCHYVADTRSGFEDTDIILKDIVTYKITIIRKNAEELKLGIGHSKYFPGLFNECLYINVSAGERILSQEKIIIDKNVTEYNFQIKMGQIGKRILTFSLKPQKFNSKISR